LRPPLIALRGSATGILALVSWVTRRRFGGGAARRLGGPLPTPCLAGAKADLAAEPPSRRAAEPPSRRAAEPPSQPPP
jgi:hypothetical protein